MLQTEGRNAMGHRLLASLAVIAATSSLSYRAWPIARLRLKHSMAYEGLIRLRNQDREASDDWRIQDDRVGSTMRNLISSTWV